MDDGEIVIAAFVQPRGFPGALDGGWGGYIEQTADSTPGVNPGFCHLSAILVTPGVQVRRGQVIGRTGNTGIPGVTVFGTLGHLHRQAVRGRERVDPTPYYAG